MMNYIDTEGFLTSEYNPKEELFFFTGSSFNYIDIKTKVNEVLRSYLIEALGEFKIDSSLEIIDTDHIFDIKTKSTK